MLIGLVILLIIVLLLLIAHLVEAIWWHNNVKSKMLLLDSVLRLLATACELMWIQSSLSEMGVIYNKLMIMYYDNQAAMYITKNPVFREWTKYIEVNCHFIKDMVKTHRIVTSFVISSCQLENIFTNALSRKSFSILYSKLDMIDIYAPVWRRALEYK